MLSDWLSLTQGIGYLAFVLGVASFLQTDDRRFKLFMAGECMAYVAHFALLGQNTAVASSLLSLFRSVMALRTRSGWVAGGVIAANLALGVWLARSPTDWLPLLASCLGTYALFRLDGVRMRGLMLVGTSLWIFNNILVGSIGGTLLEIVVAAVNLRTIVILRRAQAAPSGGSTRAPPAGAGHE